MSERQCPRCSQPLVFGRFGPLDLDICRLCGGVWFDTGELSRLNSAGPQVVRRLHERITPAQSQPSPPEGPPACPACRVPLASVEFAGAAGVRVGACSFCEGDWVPYSMLAKLAEALDSSRGWTPEAPPSPPKPNAGPAVRPTAQAQPPKAPPKPPARAAPASSASPASPAAATGGEMVCPHCSEPNSDRAAVCWACGRALEGPVIGECPTCGGAMRRRESESVTLDACEGCGSVCVTPKRLQQLILQPWDRVRKLLEYVGRFHTSKSKHEPAAPSCPHCKTPYMKSRLGMLTQQPVHSCPQCYGLLIDYETLTDILAGQQRMG